ncbi:MAG: hypothetical protein HS113_18005 [Verrucomicrobiales bacterium]|nr:hypothetical protein [Verrucomicrobiales bacterium]
MHSVAKQIERLFNHGKLQNLDDDKKLEILIRYWTIIEEENEEAWSDIKKLDDPDAKGRKDFQYKLLELTGWIAWSLIGYEILGRSYVEGCGMHWDNVRNLVKAASQIDWRKDGQYAHATGEVGGPIIFRDMQRQLPPDVAAVQQPGNAE